MRAHKQKGEHILALPPLSHSSVHALTWVPVFDADGDVDPELLSEGEGNCDMDPETVPLAEAVAEGDGDEDGEPDEVGDPDVDCESEPVGVTESEGVFDGVVH